MYKDLGTHMNGVVMGDASAALAIVARRGLGKLRHLDTNNLWIQAKAAKGDRTSRNPFTKTLSWNERWLSPVTNIGSWQDVKFHARAVFSRQQCSHQI